MSDSSSWQKAIYNADDFTNEDFATIALFTLGTVILIITAGRNLFPTDKKKLSYCISTFSSGLMSAMGVFYYATKSTAWDIFAKDPDPLNSPFHGRDNIGCAVCTIFGTILTCDMLFGTILYPQQCDFLTTYFHHGLYLFLMYFAITGDGYFTTARPFTTCFLYFLPEEIPTFLLALGTMVPRLRNDLLFGFTFFVTRIVFHLFLARYAYISNTDGVVILFMGLTTVMHLNWFYGWFTKYGIYYFTGKKKVKKEKSA